MTRIMKPEEPGPVKLLVGLLYTDPDLFERAHEQLAERFSKIDYKSPQFSFDISDYYKEEMGWPIFRKFISFDRLINPGDLAKIKIATNEIETHLAKDGKRTVNLDAGYMDFNKLILASAKFDAQKIYLDLGIYADPTLWYEKGAFKAYPHAFLDFKSGAYDATFLHIRSLYKSQRSKNAA